MQADHVASRAPSRAVLDYVAPLPRGEDAEAKTGEFIIPDDLVLFAGTCGVDNPLGDLNHGIPSDRSRSLA
jgi:hypothetical protein